MGFWRRKVLAGPDVPSGTSGLASRSHAFSGEEKAWGIAYTPLVPQECLVA